MSTTLYRLARIAVRRRRAVLAAWFVLLVALGFLTAAVSDGTRDDFTIPGTESQEAWDALGHRFPEVAGAAAQMVVVVPDGTIEDEDWRALVSGTVGDLAALPHVTEVVDPFDDAVEGAVSSDGRAALITAQVDDTSDATRDALVAAGEPLRAAGAQVELGGGAFGIETPGISPTEGVGVLVAFVVLLVTLGSLRAAGIPIASALTGAGVSMALILSATALGPISSTAPLLALMIGVAVGIDYALFIISRHREHLATGLSPDDAAARSVATAGSAVVFAGSTVVIALLALAVVDIPFLTVMGVAAAGAVVVAVLVSLTLVPALLAFAGTAVTPRARAPRRTLRDRLRRRPARARVPFARRWVTRVTAHPVLTATALVLGLAVLVVPAKDLRLALPDNGTADPSTTQRAAYDLVADHFGPGYNSQLLVMLDIVTTTDPAGVVDEIADRIAALPGVDSISLATPNASADTGVVVVIPTQGSTAESTTALVGEIRALAPELEEDYGVAASVTGQTAMEIDVSERLSAALVPYAIVVVGLSIVLLALAFRSVVVPLVGAAGYLLSVGAAFGIVTAIFEWGWFADLLHVQRVGPVISFLPIVLMGVLFGLAMDYQVFLVSRMSEAYSRGHDAARAVVDGYAAAAKVVLAAATIMIAVFAAFIPEGDAAIKPIAVGLAAGVAIDALVVRMTLMPAVMRIFGRRAWWFPRALARLPHLDIEGEQVEAQLALAAADRPDLVIEARGLGLHGSQGPVYQDVDLAVPPHSLVLLHAPQGSGKTALLLTLAGRMRPDTGTLVVCDQLLPAQADAVRRRVALGEFPGINSLDPAVTIAQHVNERVAMTRFRPWVLWTPIAEVLDFLAVCAPAYPGPTAKTLVADLSPLQRKLLGVALALMDAPDLLLVDDVDSLRTVADEVAYLDALARLVDPDDPDRWPGIVHRRTDRFRPLTVVATCQEIDQISGWTSPRLLTPAPLEVN